MVSVIVPAYNAERTIAKCISSLERQTYSDIEILVVDDGSKDGTADIVSSMAQSDCRVRLLRRQNAGVSAARNMGIQSSCGEYICFVDSDDTVDENFIEVLMSLNAPGVLAAVDVVRSDGVGSALAPIGPIYQITENMADDYFCGNLGQGIAFSVCNKLFDRRLLEEKEISFSHRLTVGEDMLFVFRYMCFCKAVGFSADAAYRYDISDGSAMNARCDYTEAYEMLLEELCNLDYLEGSIIGQGTLSRWALGVSLIIMTNDAIAQLTYKDFKVWFKGFCKTRLCDFAKKSSYKLPLKRKIFLLTIKHKLVKTLHILIKFANLLYH